MFTIIDNPTFAHDIDVEVPIDGGYETQKLKTRFKVLDIDTMIGFDVTSADGQKNFCEAAVEGFEDLQTPEGKPVTCTASIRAMLLGRPYVRRAVIAAYAAALMGASRKN